MKNFAFAISILLLLTSCASEQQKMQNEIAQLEKALKGDSSVRPDYSKAEKMIDLYQSYANKFPDDTLSASYLFKAADISAHLNKINQACDLFNMVAVKYPESFRAPYAVFMQAFLYETSLNNIDMAREKYNTFISKYSNHELWDDANQSLANLGIPVEELVKQWDANSEKDTTEINVVQ